MRTLVFGARGYLAGYFLQAMDGAEGSTADIADADQVAGELQRHDPDVVINCAGKTGRPNVDWCEFNKPETLRSNVTGPLVLLEQCLERKVFLVQMSTGCLYTGDNGGEGFSEEDEPNFLGSYYVRTKASAERLLAEFPVLILRPRMPMDGSLNPRNLIIKLSKYSRVINEPNSLTYVPDLMAAAQTLIAQRATGLFNVVNTGAVSPLEIVQRYQEIVDRSHEFTEISLSELSRIIEAGRSNCILSNSKLLGQGIEMRNVDEVLQESLTSIASQMNSPAK